MLAVLGHEAREAAEVDEDERSLHERRGVGGVTRILGPGPLGCSTRPDERGGMTIVHDYRDWPPAL